jgi:N-acetylmuramoyl-L-alanine amidase
MQNPPRLARAVVALTLAVSMSMVGPLHSEPAVTAAAQPLAGVIIALDPGHNGGSASHLAYIRRLVWIGNQWKACNTVGTTTRSGYPEHAFNFAVALRTKADLESLGAIVYMTRTTDTGVGPCIDVRGKFGAKVHAALMISIHGDGASATNSGFFVMKPGLVKGYTDDILVRSGVLAKAMRAGLTAAGLRVANYYARYGLVTRTDLGTLNMSDVPVVMIELGNMKNAVDARRMTSRTGRAQYANGIVLGIRRYLGR